MVNVTVWNENFHEKDEKIGVIMKTIHPNGIHGTIADIVKELGDKVNVRTATLDMPECGLPDDVLMSTDVLVWWAHCCHDKVPDELAAKIHMQVLKGMGLIVLHSGHLSKPFTAVLGTSGTLRWRDDTTQRMFTIEPSHPIAKGIPAVVEIGREECYAERFDIPKPDDVIFESWFDIGEVFRSGCTWSRGHGKVFYFQPGHETNKAYQNGYVRQIIKNAVEWIAPTARRDEINCPHIDEVFSK